MNGNRNNFSELTENQSRVYIDTTQVFEAYRAARKQSRSYRGGMTWKTVKGKKYLVRVLNRAGAQKSIGPYSGETELIFKQFTEGKSASEDRLQGLRERLIEQAKFCKAVKIQRVPTVTASILRMLDQNNLLGQNIVVIGTNALYAYEMAAGIFFDRPVMATNDLDLLWDIRTKLVLGINRKIPKTGIMGILRKIDSSFGLVSDGSFRARNKDGYMVDLIRALPDPILASEPKSFGNVKDLAAIGINKIQWLISSPKISQIVIGEDGFPAIITVPDPRAFATYKLWLSEQDDREPRKKKRDKAQAFAVAEVVMKYLPQYPFSSGDLRMFPRKVFKGAKEHLARKFPSGFEL